MRGVDDPEALGTSGGGGGGGDLGGMENEKEKGEERRLEGESCTGVGGEKGNAVNHKGNAETHFLGQKRGNLGQWS